MRILGLPCSIYFTLGSTFLGKINLTTTSVHKYYLIVYFKNPTVSPWVREAYCFQNSSEIKVKFPLSCILCYLDKEWIGSCREYYGRYQGEWLSSTMYQLLWWSWPSVSTLMENTSTACVPNQASLLKFSYYWLFYSQSHHTGNPWALSFSSLYAKGRYFKNFIKKKPMELKKA